MADRPAKRQRRSTIVLSDEDDDRVKGDLPLRTQKAQRQLELDHGQDATLSLSPSRTRSKTVKNASKGSARASPTTSPEKSKKSRKPKELEKSKSINSFFGRATEEQRWRQKSKTPDNDIPDGEFGDAIEDDDPSDPNSFGLDNKRNDSSVLDKRNDTLKKSLNGTQRAEGSLPSSTQRFIKPAIPSKTSESENNQPNPDESHRPWADRYGPTTLEELAIHKKKASDVQRWFENVLTGRDRQRLLILKGPAGSGKTTTVSLLAKTIGFSTAFWQNPTYYDSSTSGSVASQFDEFLNRGGHFGTLSFGNEAPQPVTHTASDHHVLIVEEFPAGMARSSGMDSFRSVILQFLANSVPSTVAPFRQQQPPLSTPPLVMIISETLLSSSTAFSESFTAHRLLGPDILNHPLTTVIEFNPVAPTFVSKALDLAIRKEARDSKRRRVPGPAVMQKLAEMGDVRNAISSLEFLCVRNDSNADWSGSIAARPKKTSKVVPTLTDMEQSSLQLISQRETTLDMFHAAAKIMYNKRDDPRITDPKSELPPKPPDHLMHLYSPKISQVDIEALLSETGTDIQTFISTLHENYILSCNGESFTDTFENCSDVLSISDVLNPDSRRSLRSHASINASIVQSHLQGGSFDTLRQDEISFNIATRGLLFNLPYPVSRAAPSSGRKADSFKMYYPTSLRLWKPTEEIEALVSTFMHDEILDSGKAVKIKIEPGSEGVATWKVRSNLTSTYGDANDDNESEIRKVTPSRDTLTTEVLPYLTKIKIARREESKTLAKITRFTGSGSMQMQLNTSEEPDDDDHQLSDEAIVAAKKTSSSSRFASSSTTTAGGSVARRNVVESPQKFNKGTTILSRTQQQQDESVGLEKMYLEDDDIVDD